MTREDVHWLLYQNQEDTITQGVGIISMIRTALLDYGEDLGFASIRQISVVSPKVGFPCKLPGFFIRALANWCMNLPYESNWWEHLESLVYVPGVDNVTCIGTFGQLLEKVASFTEMYSTSCYVEDDEEFCEYIRCDRYIIAEDCLLGYEENTIFFEEGSEPIGVVFAPLNQDGYEGEDPGFPDSFPLLFSLVNPTLYNATIAQCGDYGETDITQYLTNTYDDEDYLFNEGYLLSKTY